MVKRWKRDQRGQAIVESALVLPIILMLILGTVELGRMSNAYLVVTHAARHGARHAAVGAANEEIISRVKLASSPLNTSDLTVVISPGLGRRAGDDVQVTVTYPLKMITPLAGAVFSDTVTVRAQITMRME